MYFELCAILPIFRTLAYLEPEAPLKACQISGDQAYSEPWHSHNSLFKHFHEYLGIFRDIDAYSATLTCMQLSGRGEACPALFEN